MKFNFRLLRYYPFFFQLREEYDLTESETMLFGFLFNYCINLQDGGYCGYSNENIASKSGIPERTVKRAIQTLKDKGLIVIQNPGRRIKSPGLSRMIYINADLFIDEQQMDLFDQSEELANLKAEIKDLKKQIADQKSNDTVIDYLVSYGLIRASDKARAVTELLPIYRDILKADNYSFTRLQRHLSYVKNHMAADTVGDRVSYLKRAAEQYKNRLK